MRKVKTRLTYTKRLAISLLIIKVVMISLLITNSLFALFPESKFKSEKLDYEVITMMFYDFFDLEESHFLQNGNHEAPFYFERKNKKKYVLKCLGELGDINLQDVCFILEFWGMNYRYSRNCPRLVKNREGKYYTVFHDKIYIMMTYLRGDPQTYIQTEDYYDLGVCAAEIQNAYREYDKEFIHKRRWKNRFGELIMSSEYSMGSKGFFKHFQSEYYKYIKNYPRLINGLEMTPIHYDLHKFNTKFKDGKVYMLDFQFSQFDYRVSEFENIILGDPDHEGLTYTFEKLYNTVLGYQVNVKKKLNEMELGLIAEVLRGRFLRNIINYTKKNHYDSLFQNMEVFDDFRKDFRIENFAKIFNAS